jgi:nitrogen fixation protein FixH
LIIILSASMAALFGFFALIIAVNFDLAIGGKL